MTSTAKGLSLRNNVLDTPLIGLIWYIFEENDTITPTETIQNLYLIKPSFLVN